jgi:ectoine hydroxylase-related dioxygenase (phytanoyl-CoA dioxygenase family)
VIFQHLERYGIAQGGAWRPAEKLPSAGLFDAKPMIRQLNRHQAIIDLVGGKAMAAASALVGGQPNFAMSRSPGLLFTLPAAGAWTLPHLNWHQDIPRMPEEGPPGVQVFAMLDTVEPGGGGTLAVTGSHRLVNVGVRISSSDLRKRLRREPYFAALMSDGTADRMRFMREAGHVGDVELHVVEMAGEPGDVYFMDMRLLHTVAPNTRRIPRLMLTERYLLAHARRALSGE